MNPEHLAIVQQGRGAIDDWRRSHPRQGVDLGAEDFRQGHFPASLRGVDLDGCDLAGANFSVADLAGAKFRSAVLSKADFLRADLSFADLSRSHLEDANFHFTDLRDADLSHTVLIGTRFARTDLTNADFLHAILGNTEFISLDLSRCKNLETAVFQRPCTIGIDTLYRSRGHIPESVLVKCGVPDALIKYLPSLLGAQEAIQFYSCFISFSFKDQEFCDRLHSRMRQEHLRVWYAADDMPGGRKVHEVIQDTIRLYDKVLLVLSDASMNSEWVGTEIYHARQREVVEKKQVLFPIRLIPFERIREWRAFDADIGKDMAREVREYFIPDFSNWKDNDAFEEAFKRLMNDLKASAT